MPSPCGAGTRLLALPCSFSHMMSYYGLIFDLQNLGSDIFLLQVLFGAVDFLARATSSFLLRFFGRRVVLASFQAMGGLSILANVLVPQGEARAAGEDREGAAGRQGPCSPVHWPPSPPQPHGWWACCPSSAHIYHLYSLCQIISGTQSPNSPAHFPKEAEIQSGKVTCPGSLSWQESEPGSDGTSGPEAGPAVGRRARKPRQASGCWK